MRWDSTWRLLLEWTDGQGQSERLAAQALASEGFESIDPSHPLGGPDGGKDAVCIKGGQRWVMAVYFPRGEQSLTATKAKLLRDLEGVKANGANGLVFVTNQELRLADRDALMDSASPTPVDLFHLERLTLILDKPNMAGVREQFLGIGNDGPRNMSLGGKGGKAMGAGGGGGGAFGGGALGGPGGRGGDIRLGGRSGEAPGSGGGGAGAIGEGAIGGEGGGGGELLSGVFLAKDLPSTIEIKVGRGGKGGLGADGEDGEASAVGDLLVARGGKGGRAGRHGLLGRTVTPEDVANGLRVCSIYLANCAEMREGLLYLLSAGWANWTTPTLPMTAQWPLVFSVSMGSTEIGGLIKLYMVVTDPTGIIAFQQGIDVPGGDTPGVVLRHVVHGLQFPVATPGVWSITVESGGYVLTRLPIEVRHKPA